VKQIILNKVVEKDCIVLRHSNGRMSYP